MAEKRNTSADHLTFSQRYGYEQLPQPMQLEELSDDLRREIWNSIRELLLEKREYFTSYYFKDDAKRFIERVFGQIFRRHEDEIETAYEPVLASFKSIVLQMKFHELLSAIEIVVNDRDSHQKFLERLKVSFDRHAAAYWLDTSSRPFRFYPRSSKEQGEATQRAIETIRESGMEGAATHLHQATEHINARQYADSVADSIHAVESVARRIDPKANRTLDPALDSLKGTGVLKHTAFVEAFKKLYGYTSDEQGIRHALLDQKSADVGLDEAVFMFGACASFAAYLVNKHRQM